MAADELLAAGNAALEAGRWEDARAAFEGVLQEREAAEALDGLGEALWWLGETHLSVEYRKRAYARFRRAGDPAAAAMTAIWLCLTYKANFGNQAASGGWIARAERVLKDVEEGGLRGWLLMARAYHTEDLDLALDLGQRALEVARASDDLDLELCTLSGIGKSLVAMGKVEEGFTLIDEAMAGTLGGEARALDTVVFTCCDMLTACECAADLERAAQWCRVADEFTEKYGCPYLYAACRTHYGSVLVATGHWEQAERELTAALRMTTNAAPAMRARAVSRLAGLRLAQGRLEEAEALLWGVDDHLAALPAATLRLARGEPAAAAALLERRLALEPVTLEAGPILEKLAEAHLAQGDLDAAATAVERLSAIAREHGREDLVAWSAVASAGVSAARGEHDLVIRDLQTALGLFSRLQLPLETARARLELARVLAAGEPEVSVAEARSALAAFETLGAAADADAAASLLRSLGVKARTGPKHVGVLTRREQEVLQLVGVGLSNPEIANRLFISRKTAAHHVSSVLSKLGLRNRAEAVRYATRTLGETTPK